MSHRFLLDTNVVSEPLLASPRPRALAWLEAHAASSAIPSIVLHELTFGLERLPRGKRRDRMRAYVEDVVKDAFTILDYGADAAEWHGRERARLATAGKTPPFVDGQIAAIAAVSNLTLVTSNTRDFAPFRNLTVQRFPV